MTHFAIHSSADRLWLLIFDQPSDCKPAREIELVRKGDLFTKSLPRLAHGTTYVYRTEEGARLLDPCARAVHTPNHWGDTSGLEVGVTPDPELFFPKGVIVDDDFDWGDDSAPNTPLEKSIIYEAHLRGFTKNGSDGTYLDFIEKIPYLQELGITAVEFLPIFEFNELEYFMSGGSRQHLLNFWGYSTRSFYAPMSHYSRSREPGAAVDEFKTLVKALHAAGIEVILDVVFNHSAEGEKDGPVYNFRALDNDAYYIQGPDGSYHNWSGCGNTFNANHPVAQSFIVESLRMWANEMRVDGFRFDLATALCRDPQGNLLEKPPLIAAIEADPDLKKVKLIAEAWDCGGYQVGNFPSQRFSDWNGRYRDDARRFWNYGHAVGPLATRLAGSADLYEGEGGSPLQSINFITAHDGFTLADLVSYCHKHNDANGEENRDGENQNNSINYGIEGPTDHQEIRDSRIKQQKNLLATLLLSQGVPMLLAGDEFGRTQHGSNNAYCQDNETSWVDWSLLDTNRDLFEFSKKLIALRRTHPALQRKTFFTGADDIRWFGENGDDVQWDCAHGLGMHLLGDEELIVLINNESHPISFGKLPAKVAGKTLWKLEVASGVCTGTELSQQSIAVYSRTTI